jgi:hypothetical protein
MSKKVQIVLTLVALIALGTAFYYSIFIENKPAPAFRTETAESSEPKTIATPDETVKKLEDQINSLLLKSEPAKRTLDLPPPISETPVKKKPTEPEPETAKDPDAPSRKIPPPQIMGVVLNDNTPVYTTADGWDLLCELQTGDLISPLPVEDNKGRRKIRPRVDVFLAATTRMTESAGRKYPSAVGWVDGSKIQILSAEQAVDYTQKTDAFTLAEDPNFSMVDFYTRAMKNPDPAVHRIVGARLIALVSLHEDYNSSWIQLYRDPDPRLRSLALSTLRERGVGRSRLIVEDLIARLTELTKNRATGDEETEVILILDILKASGHSRVPSAFASFREGWAGKQNQRILDGLQP